MDDTSRMAALRKALQQRRTELRGEVRTAEQDRRADMADAIAESADRETMSSDHQRAEVDEAEEARDRRELAQVEAALARLEQGSYGECIDCGKTIPWPRLQAQPAAERCVACQQRAEAGRR